MRMLKGDSEGQSMLDQVLHDHPNYLTLQSPYTYASRERVNLKVAGLCTEEIAERLKHRKEQVCWIHGFKVRYKLSLCYFSRTKVNVKSTAVNMYDLSVRLTQHDLPDFCDFGPYDGHGRFIVAVSLWKTVNYNQYDNMFVFL